MLRCHILELLTVVKGTIQAELPPKLIILFYGCWTVGTHHYYIGIAAAYFKVGADGKEAPVHKILPVNETLHADGSKSCCVPQITSFTWKKSLNPSVAKAIKNIICLVRDANCSVNQSMACILGTSHQVCN
jgi:hypothetical protein